MLAASQVLMPGGRLLPPGLGALIMLSPGTHHHPRTALRHPRLHRVAVKNKTVDPLTKSTVTQSFERSGMFQPAFVIVRRECFSSNNSFTVNVRCGGHPFAGLQRHARGSPEFPHGFV